MRWEQPVARGVSLVVVALVALACGGDDDQPSIATSSSTAPETDAYERCLTAVDEIADATARYVAGYEAAVIAAAPSDRDPDPDGGGAAGDESPTSPIDEVEYQAVLEDAQAHLAERRCEPLRTRVELRKRLLGVDASTPVAEAVLAQLTATLTDPAASAPVDVSVGPADDLRTVVAAAADGSTIRLAAGDHRLDGPLIVLSGVRFVGAGVAETTLSSDAPDAVVVALTDATVRFEGLTVRHEGAEPASVLLGGPASSMALSDAVVSGARVDPDGLGGTGILLFAADGAEAGRGTTLELTDVVLRDNEAGGMVATGGHRLSALRLRVEGSGQCGLCFFDSADGSVEDSVLVGNAVGVAVTGEARPTLLGLQVDGGDVGLQVAGAGAPVVRDIAFNGQTQAAAIFSELAAGDLDAVRCAEVDFGFVVGPESRPMIGETDCDVVRPPS